MKFDTSLSVLLVFVIVGILGASFYAFEIGLKIIYWSFGLMVTIGTLMCENIYNIYEDKSRGGGNG